MPSNVPGPSVGGAYRVRWTLVAQREQSGLGCATEESDELLNPLWWLDFRQFRFRTFTVIAPPQVIITQVMRY